MTTYKWTDLVHGSSVSFNPETDIFDFDIDASAADFLLGLGSSSTLFTYAAKTVTLLAPPEMLAVGNLTFGFGGILIVGDGTTETADDGMANSSGGSPGNDQLIGLDGHDALDGGDGGDYIAGGNGNDTLNGALGNDTLIGGDGTNVLNGDSGDDVFIVESVTPISREPFGLIAGGAGSQDAIWFTGTPAGDLLILNPEKVSGIEVARICDAFGDSSGRAPLRVSAAHLTTGITLIGNDGPNYLAGSALENNVILGNGGSDLIVDQAGDDSIDGGSGKDFIYAEGGIDTIRGGSGNDIIMLIQGNSYTPGDIFDGGSGRDALRLGNFSHLDLTVIPNSDIKNVESIQAGFHTLTLGLADVLAISRRTDKLRIGAHTAEAEVNVVGTGWVQGADVDIGGHLHHTYTKGLATLLIDDRAVLHIN